MIKFKQHTGIVLPLNISNIDTDAIIPKQFLQTINRNNLGKNLFYNWRFIDDLGQKLNYKFIMNKSCYKNASILLTRENFGCGSSREHAPWALIDYGFKVIISSSFADIFYINSFNNGLLLITLSKSNIDELFDQIKIYKTHLLTINLKIQQIFSEKKIYYFKISDFHKNCILHGFDIINLTLINEKKIIEYENCQLEFLK